MMTSTAPALTSAAGIISLLDEPEAELKVYSLQKLNAIVDQFWAEIADSVAKIEALYEDEKFEARELAALVASKVFYNLGEYDDSLTFALGAGKLFDASERNEFVETIVAKCIDKYIALSTAHGEDAGKPIDPRLTDVVERMFQRCFDDGEYKQAIGIALESRRLDVISRAVKQGSFKELLPYVLESSMTLVQNLEFRNKVLGLLVNLYQELPEPDYIAVAQCLVYLNDDAACAEMLNTLVRENTQTSLLTAYQIAFDLEDTATQDFLQKLLGGLPAGPSEALPSAAAATSADAMETDEKKEDVKAGDEAFADQFGKIRTILSGDLSIKLYLEFLFRTNKTDMLIIKNTKNALESRSSMYHSAVTFANAFMNAGTTSDEFLRQNLEWLSRATNWSKFSATAALGVLHKGHISQGQQLLAPYLPQDGVSSSQYSEGGALFALGLIYANHGAGIINYLTNALKNTQNETIQHGACLGIGVAAMATANDDIYEQLKSILFSDSAVAGEAAGYALGLVMLGTASQKALDEMLQYAHETQHEKIIRGLAVGMSLIMYGKEEEADTLIEQLCTDKDQILRYGGIFTVAMAYAGTGNNKAIRRLLHVAVSDVNDDVRRAAVMSLGFVLFRTPKQVPRVVQLLAESYNPHVRYGATMALAFSCAGSGSPEALELIEPMIKDPVDYVRQGALIAMAMVLMQQNEATSPKVASTRKLYEKIIGDKHEDSMSKFGATIGQGIIDAGGRNVTISLATRSGLPNMSAIVGAVMFSQFWYWFPLSLFLSLSFTPTAYIGLNVDLKIPEMEIISNSKPSTFAYPSPTKPPTVEKVEKVATAVLSTTAKAKQRAKKSEKEKEEKDAIDTDEKKPEVAAGEDKMEEDKKEEEGETKEEGAEDKESKKKEEEPNFDIIPNVSRLLQQQLPLVTFKDDSRYTPIKKPFAGGITMLMDRHRGDEEKLMEFSTLAAPPPAATDATGTTAAAAVPEDTGPEPEPPAPFEYPFTD